MVESITLDGAVFDEIIGSKDHDALKVCPDRDPDPPEADKMLGPGCYCRSSAS